MRRALPLLLLSLIGCGSAPAAELPPPAEPAASPPQGRPAAGTPLAPAAARAAVDDPREARGVRSDRDAGVLLAGGRPVRVRGLLAPDGVAAAGEDALLVVDARRRQLVLLDARTLTVRDRAPAGVGPTTVVAGGPFAYVADTAGDALLAFRVSAGALDPIRYVHLPGSPGPMAIDRRRAYRVWVALTARNELVGLPAHGRPHPVERLPTVRGARAVGTDPSTGRVVVLGADAAHAFAP